MMNSINGEVKKVRHSRCVNICMFKKKFTLLMLARAYSVKIGAIFGVWFESRKVDEKANLYEN